MQRLRSARQAKTAAKEKLVAKKEISDEDDEDESAPPLLEMETDFGGEKGANLESTEKSTSSDDRSDEQDKAQMSVYEYIQSKISFGTEEPEEVPSTSYPDLKATEPDLSQLFGAASKRSVASSSSSLKRPHDNGRTPPSQFRWMSMPAEEAESLKGIPKRGRIQGDSIQRILQSMKPVQVDVAVGNHATSSTSSITSHENSPEEGATEDDVRQQLKMAVGKKVGDSIVKDASAHSILLALKACIQDDGVFMLFEASRCLYEHEIRGNNIEGIVETFCKYHSQDIERFVYKARNVKGVAERMMILEKSHELTANILLSKKTVYIKPTTTTVDTSFLPTFRWSATQPNQALFNFEAPFRVPEKVLGQWLGNRPSLDSNIDDFVECFLKNCTDPVDLIREYTAAEKNHTQFKYKKIPRAVQDYLKECIQHIFEFDRKELQLSVREAKGTRFYELLGNTDESREESFLAYQAAHNRIRGCNFRNLLVRTMQTIRRCVLVDGRLVRKK